MPIAWRPSIFAELYGTKGDMLKPESRTRKPPKPRKPTGSRNRTPLTEEQIRQVIQKLILPDRPLHPLRKLTEPVIREVLQQLQEGKPAKEIAQSMNLSPAPISQIVGAVDSWKR